MTKSLVSIFGQTTVYRISNVSREPIRLPEIQCPLFGINKCNYTGKYRLRYKNLVTIGNDASDRLSSIWIY